MGGMTAPRCSAGLCPAWMARVRNFIQVCLDKVFEEYRAEVSFAGIRQHDYNRLPLELGQRRQAERHCNCRATRNSGKNTLLTSQAPRYVDGLFVRYRFHAIHHGEIERVRNNARADALDFVRARLEIG